MERVRRLLELVAMERSTGILSATYKDGLLRVCVDVDEGIAAYARSLVPKSARLSVPRYPPHISVIREPVCDLPTANGDMYAVARFGGDGREVEFEYDANVVPGGVYWWLRAWCQEMVWLRVAMGLSASSAYTRPPDGEECLHVTIGNLKG